MPNKRISDLDMMHITDAVYRLEHAIASCLLADPVKTVRLCKSSNVLPVDFIFNVHSSCARAAFSVVAVPQCKGRERSFAIRAANQLMDYHERSERRELFWLVSEAPQYVSRLTALISRMSKIGKQLREVERHRMAALAAMNEAFRLTQRRFTDERNRTGEGLARPARPVAVKARELPAARDVRAVGLGAGMVVGTHQPERQQTIHPPVRESRWRKRAG